ncbi:MAG TPA: ATP-binding protein [Chromatiales bacterium]|nr:ATP-binding protein [Chromatiales bacterium]
MNDDLAKQLLEQLDKLTRHVEKLAPTLPTTNWNSHAFRWRKPGYLQTVDHPHKIKLDDLLHIERQKQALIRNTEKFIQGKPANHALLWGSRGTGKSSLIKGLLNEYANQKLRLIEVEKQDLINLPDIVESLYTRKERFILFSDDLSFEADDPGYKHLKAALDGSIATPPENVLIYATSNRRHLMPEFMQENQQTQLIENELHHGEAVEEKISLSERFGLWLSFYPLKQEQYLDIVYHWLKQLNVDIRDKKKMETTALQFALYRGSRSGRVARQFVNDWSTPD